MFYFMTDRRIVLEKLARIIDIEQTYHETVRRPNYVTERHADIGERPDGGFYAYIADDVLWEHKALIMDEFERRGIDRETVRTKWQRIRDKLSVNESVTIPSGPLAGVTIAWAEKDAEWESVIV